MAHDRARRPPRWAMVLAWLAGASVCQAGAEMDPWRLLQGVREHLAASPRSAQFVQEFQPAGFSTGDRERGKICMSLPSCLRWDYETPFAKTFLLSGETMYSWNAGEASGRRFFLDGRHEPGLDLLRLRFEELQPRYTARLQELANGSLEVTLMPRSDGSDLSAAHLTVDKLGERLLEVGYQDAEGNTTRFEIRNYQPLHETRCCAPPGDVTWIDE